MYCYELPAEQLNGTSILGTIVGSGTPIKCIQSYCNLKSRNDAQTACESIGGTLLEMYNDIDYQITNDLIFNFANQTCGSNHHWIAGKVNCIMRILKTILIVIKLHNSADGRMW